MIYVVQCYRCEVGWVIVCLLYFNYVGLVSTLIKPLWHQIHWCPEANSCQAAMSSRLKSWHLGSNPDATTGWCWTLATSLHLSKFLCFHFWKGLILSTSQGPVSIKWIGVYEVVSGVPSILKCSISYFKHPPNQPTNQTKTKSNKTKGPLWWLPVSFLALVCVNITYCKSHFVLLFYILSLRDEIPSDLCHSKEH